MMYRNAEGSAAPTAGSAISNIGREISEEKRRVRGIKRRRKVYVVSKFAGDIPNNVKLARRYCRFAASKKYIPIASHLMFPQFLNDKDPKERELGLLYGLALLKCCYEVWCFGTDISAGMKQEIEEAKRLNKPIRYFTTDMEEIK